MARMRARKEVICPLCNQRHGVLGRYWLLKCTPYNVRAFVESFCEGYQTEFWCDVEYVCVVKRYSPSYRYIGYYLEDEIPF